MKADILTCSRVGTREVQIRLAVFSGGWPLRLAPTQQPISPVSNRAGELFPQQSVSGYTPAHDRRARSIRGLGALSTQLYLLGLREVEPPSLYPRQSRTAVLVKQHSDMERSSLSQVPSSHSIATARMGNKWRTDAGVRGLTRPPWTVTQDTLTPSQAWLYRVTASLYARTRPGGGHSVLV